MSVVRFLGLGIVFGAGLASVVAWRTVERIRAAEAAFQARTDAIDLKWKAGSTAFEDTRRLAWVDGCLYEFKCSKMITQNICWLMLAYKTVSGEYIGTTQLRAGCRQPQDILSDIGVDAKETLESDL